MSIKKVTSISTIHNDTLNDSISSIFFPVSKFLTKYLKLKWVKQFKVKTTFPASEITVEDAGPDFWQKLGDQFFIFLINQNLYKTNI